MYRDFLMNKWVLGSVGFLIVFAVRCVLWYQHGTADERKAAAEAEELLRQSEIAKKVSDTDSVAEQAADAPAENTTAEKPVNENTAEAGNNTKAETQKQSGTPAANAEVEDVPTSPFGLGPYPEIPKDYIIPPSKFKWEFWGETLEDELMSRVRIKLWKQGILTEGSSFENGKVYPVILGTVYVVWDGEIVRRITGHPDDDFDAIEAALEAGQPPPEGITVLNRNEAGIDPYTFLELNKKE
jgi:hypothetical protein